MTAKSNMMEGRKRILKCLAECGAEQEPIILLDLQKQYFEQYEQYLNKEELRMFFSKGHIKQVLEQFMADDVDLTTNIQETGSLYISMKRPLAEALAAPLPVLAKNRVPVAEPKPAPILVSLPLGGLPASKPLVPLNKSSKIVSAYSLSVSKPKGNEKMAASSTTNTPPLLQKVGAGNKYLNEEESGGLEYAYAPSEALYEPKSAKIINASKVVMSKQPVDAAGLYSDSEDEKDEEEQLKDAEKELEDLEGEDEEDEDLNEWGEEVGDEEEEEEDEEDDYGDEALAQNDLLLKSSVAKMAATDEVNLVVNKKKGELLPASSTLQRGPSIAISSRSNAQRYMLRVSQMKAERLAAMQNAINEKKEDEEDTECGLEEKQPIVLKEKKQPMVVTKMVRRLAEMPEGGTHSRVVGKTVGTKPMPKPPVAGKFCIPEYLAAAEIMMRSSSEDDEEEEMGNGFSFAEATTEEMANSGESPEIGMENAGEKVEEAVGNKGNQENGGNASNLGVIQAYLQSIVAPYGNAPMPIAGAQQQKSAMPATLPAAMPDAFKQQMLAVITIVIKLESVYKAHDLHAKFAAGCYATEYSAHFPSVDALVQFVRQNCNFVKVQAFGGNNEVFLLETQGSTELDRLFQKVGKSLQAAASK